MLIFQLCMLIFSFFTLFLQFLIPLKKGRPPKEEKLADSLKYLNTCLDLIENVWLKDKLFLTGNTISVADILGACEIEQPRKLYTSFGKEGERGRERFHVL